ncbi:hypothetical protein D3C79_1051160 [compost metagenome]
MAVIRPAPLLNCWATCRVKARSLSNLPASLLIVLATTAKDSGLDISPLRLSTLPRFFSVS